VYGLVVRLLTANAAILLAVVQILGPFATQLYERGDVAGIARVLKTSTRWVTTFSGPFLVLLLLLGTRVVTALHQRGGAARAAIAILCAAFLVDAMTGPVAQVITMSGRPALNFANNAAGLVCNIALNLLLIPRFGITGAALSWAAVIFGINAARLIELRLLLGIGPFSTSLWKPAAGVGTATAIAVATLLWTTRIGMVSLAQIGFVALVFAGSYALMLLLFDPSEEDRTLFRTIAGRRETVG
jgi:O-antigen/teichoic acid export membrane protein